LRPRNKKKENAKAIIKVRPRDCALAIEKYLPLLNKAVEYLHVIGHSKFEKIETTDKFQDDFLNNRFIEIKNSLKRELEYLKND
jgi:hypothetical protein